jgi:outer membrane biosynthesis protein TonB
MPSGPAMRIGKWDITFLFSLFCSLVINSGMVGVVVLHTRPPKVVNLSAWHARPAPLRVSEAPPAEAVYTPDIPPPPPPPSPPPPPQQPKPKVEFDPRQAFGERGGAGEALDSSPGEQPMMSRLGTQEQAFLGRNPPRVAGGGGGGGGQGGQAGSPGKAGPPARMLIGAASPAESAAPRVAAQPKPAVAQRPSQQSPQQAKPNPAIAKSTPAPSPPAPSPPVPQQANAKPDPNGKDQKSVAGKGDQKTDKPATPKPNAALAKSAAPPVPPPASVKAGTDEKAQPAIAGTGEEKIDKPDLKPGPAIEQNALANQPSPPQPKMQVAMTTPLAPPAPPSKTPPSTPLTQPADPALTKQAPPPSAPPAAPPAVQVALAPSQPQPPPSPSSVAAASGRPGAPGAPGSPAPAGPPNSTPDAAPASDKDSDPFSDINSFKFVNGRVQARNGREVKTVRPHLSESGWQDVWLMGHATVTFLAEIDAHGNVTGVRLYRTSGSDNIDLPCEQALSQWTFEPSKDKNGRAMADTLSVTFGFY